MAIRPSVKNSLALCLYLLLCSPSSEAAKPRCECLLASRSTHKLSPVKHTAAIEMELDSTASVLHLLTTEDGTVGPVLPLGHSPPASLTAWASKLSQGRLQLEELPWDKIGPDKQLKILRFAAQFADFGASRAIKGLKVRENMEIKFQETLRFLGQKYQSGTSAQINLSPLLEHLNKGSVHYVSRRTMPQVSMVEIHTRRRGRASHLMKDSWQLLQILGIPRTGQHVHVVGELPLSEMHNNPIFKSLQMGDFYRRADLLAQFLSILRGIPIREKIDPEYNQVSFTILGGKKMAEIYKDLLESAQQGTPLPQRRRSGWVSLRGSTTYDEPNLWGLEFKSVGRNANLKVYGPVLDVLQSAMADQNYGFSEEFIERWMRAHWPSNLGHGRLLEGITYCNGLRSPWNLTYNPLDHMEGLFPTMADSRAFYDKVEKNQEIRMLIHNWAYDPLVFERPAALEKIEAAQVLGVERIQAREPAGQTVRTFLFESGLLDLLGRSFGIVFTRNL